VTGTYGAVLCDIDGVLRHWPASDELERAHGLALGTIGAAAFAPARLMPAITGEVSDEEWRAGVAEDLAQVCGTVERARAAVTAWSELVPVVDHEVVALLARVRRVVPLALVSNATSRLETDLVRQGLADLPHTVVNTSRIGVAKPDPQVYRIAAGRVRVPVDRCLFVDDTEPNVEAARAAGMTALHYRRPEDLRAALYPLLPDTL